MALVLQVFGYKQDLTCQAKKTKKIWGQNVLTKNLQLLKWPHEAVSKSKSILSSTTLHVFAHFWIRPELGRVRYCQDGDNWSRPTKLQICSSETYEWCLYICILTWCWCSMEDEGVTIVLTVHFYGKWECLCPVLWRTLQELLRQVTSNQNCQPCGGAR